MNIIFTFRHLFFIITILYLQLSSTNNTVVWGLEATFTPSPDKDTGSTDGPLPLSQKQRNQLLQLDQQISSSPNPSDTLAKVAQANDMTSEELGSLLMRNRRDMQMASGGGGGLQNTSSTLPRQIIKLLSSLFLLAAKSATAHPRSFSIIFMTCLTILFILISAPRNGIVLSTGRHFGSSGHSTFLPPPTRYLSKCLDNGDCFKNAKSSLPKSVKKGGDLSKLFTPTSFTTTTTSSNDKKNKKESESTIGVFIEKLSKKQQETYAFAITARKKVPFEVLLPSEEDLELMLEKDRETVMKPVPRSQQQQQQDSKDGVVDNTDLIMKRIQNHAWEDSILLAYTSTQHILSSRRFSEFVPTPSERLRFYSKSSNYHHRHPSSKEGALLIMKSMGDWGRYGIQPLCVSYKEDSPNLKSVVYHTLKGGHFDGEIKFQVELEGDIDQDHNNNDKNTQSECNVIVSVTLLIPKKGRSLKPKLASKMVSILAESIASSGIMEAKQILSRKLQSTLYRGRARNKAAEKRHVAFENMKMMEEMAEERRRRWQRSNPDAGRYRPSGDRMRSPGGGPSRGW